MVYTSVIYKAIEDVSREKTEWLNAHTIQKDVEKRVGAPVSTQKIGFHLGVIARIYHFETRGPRDKGREYLPRALIFGRG